MLDDFQCINIDNTPFLINLLKDTTKGICKSKEIKFMDLPPRVQGGMMAKIEGATTWIAETRTEEVLEEDMEEDSEEVHERGQYEWPWVRCRKRQRRQQKK